MYLKLEFLKLRFVCFCFAADFQANPTDISSKKAGKFKRQDSDSETAYLFEPENNTKLFLKISDL